MDFNRSLFLYGCVILFFILNNNINHIHCKIFMATNYGATRDVNGRIDNKLAFETAWKDACKTIGGILVIPRGTYGLSGATFSGPCNAPTTVVMNGNLIASHIPIPNRDYWIMFSGLNNLLIFGNGTFNGNGAYSWEHTQYRKVASLKLMSVTDVSVRGITSLDSKMFHIIVHRGERVTIDGVNIRAPDESPNTDGIHVGLSKDVVITNSQIGTGDDCISIGHGSQNVYIKGIFCGPGHGISIGSLGRPGEMDVRGVKVINCTFTGTQNGVRIKTIAPSPPIMASNITFQNIVMNDVKNPIFIDQHYCPSRSTSMCPKTQRESSVSISNVKFINIRGNSVTSMGVKIECSKIKPCKDIQLNGVHITYKGQPAHASYLSAKVELH